MKLHHAAGLVLVGWYLMIPPSPSYNQDGSMKAFPPISAWTVSSAHDASAECESAKEHILGDALGACNKNPRQPSAGNRATCDQVLWEFLGQALHAQCIATDDPRLKGR